MATNEQMIQLTKFWMIAAGFWKRPISYNKHWQTLFSTYCLIMQFSIFFLWLLLLVEMIRLYLQGYETIIVLESFGLLITVTKIVIKIVAFHKNNILDLYDEIIKKEDQIWKSEDQNVKIVYSKYVKISRKMVLCQAISTSCGVFSFSVLGVLGNKELLSYNRTHNVTLESHFWYQMWFPGNKLEHLPVWYGLNTVVSWSSALYQNITHIIIFTLFVAGAAQVNLLRVEITNCQLNRHVLSEKERTLILKGIILRHLDLIRFIQKVNRKTSNVLLMDFLLSSIDISSIAVNLAKKTTIQTVWHFIFFCILFFQIFFTTWPANEIRLQSVKIADSLYETNWISLDKGNAQLMQIMIMRAQRPLNLTVGPFGPMTMETGLKILKAAYSYVSIMKE